MFSTPLRSACLVVVLSCLGCQCPNLGHIGGRLDGGSFDGGTGGGGAGQGGGTGGGNGGGFSSGPLTISPRDPVIDVVSGQPVPTVQFSASENGASVTPSWSASALGSVDPTGLFRPAGSVGGVATITAISGNATDSTTVTVRLHLVQNGSLGGTSDAGVGGVGGVGGEGEGGPVSPQTLAVLQSTPMADPGLTWLYPYEQTVWPRGILAPLLQWQRGAQSADAVGIHLECAHFTWDGAFARTATPFIHHPIPQAVWKQLGDSCAAQTVQAKLVFAAGGVAYGPLTESWRIAPGFLKGVVYYNSYGTSLALNYPGALPNGQPFGGATLAIRGGSTDPVLVAGRTGPSNDCRVCHVVSADGSTLLSQQGDNNAATSSYALRAGNAETPMSPGDGRFAWGGLSPDGTFLLSNAAPLQGASSAPSALYQVPGGALLPSTGLPSGLRAATPVFAPDGRSVAYNWYGGTGADGRSLALNRFTRPGTFSDFATLHTPPAGRVDLYPSFLPTGTGVVFQVETQSDGRGFAETRSTCDSSGPCSDVGAHGELWWVDIATKQAHALTALNGVGLPTGPNAHGADATLNYEPTVSPIPSGGYAWVIFTSRRLYGNVATINPFWSDPRFHDLTQSATTKKLWVAAIDLNAAPGTDPSHPAFYLPAQELLAGNSRGYWSLEPCRADAESCGSGDQCCGGYCRGLTETDKTCSSNNGGTCAHEFERCTTSAGCCDNATGTVCVNQLCIKPNIN